MKTIIRKYHEGQYRNYREGFIPGKVPYYDHLFGVESILSFALNKFDECQDVQIKRDMLSAALGHDLLEDTTISEDEIIAYTNSRVLSLIKELTNPMDDAHTEQYMQQLSNASEEARLIKYADLIENTTCVCHNMHIVGDEWYENVYRPILFGTMAVLKKAEFPKYPRTAEFLRGTLEMFADLLNSAKHIPFQYPVKVIQAAREAISDNDLHAHIKKSHDSFRTVCKLYKMGCITKDEVNRRFSSELQKGFYDYLCEKRLYTRFNDDTWARFLDDYSLWYEEKQPCSVFGGAWLVYNDSEEASCLDKNSFFKLMDAYSIPASYFKPFPDRGIKPKCHFHSNSSVIVRFDLSDDGGMYSCDSPIDKGFILTNENGLKAVIYIERMGKKDETHNTMDTQYVGRGTIEGYTSTRLRTIFISKREDDTVYFWIPYGKDDYDVLYHFPLWDSYNAYMRDWDKRRREHLHELFLRFNEPIY